jgi:hypothetical protein
VPFSEQNCISDNRKLRNTVIGSPELQRREDRAAKEFSANQQENLESELVTSDTDGLPEVGDCF